MAEKKVLSHQDNAPNHKAMVTVAKLNELVTQLLPHPPYSPGLTPSDLTCSQVSKESFRKQFDTNNEVSSETNAFSRGLDTNTSTRKASKC